MHHTETWEDKSKIRTVLDMYDQEQPNHDFIVVLEKRKEDIIEHSPLIGLASSPACVIIHTLNLAWSSLLPFLTYALDPTHFRSAIFNTVFLKFSPVNIPR